MKIGITGAFGFLGSNFIATLLREGYSADNVIAFYSHTRENPVFDASLVTSRKLDIRNYNDVLEKTKDIDILCHFAGKVSYRKTEARSIWETNVHGSRNIFEAGFNNHVAKILYISSINVLGAPPVTTTPGTEENNVYDKRYKNPNYIESSAMALALIERSLKGDFSFLKKVKVPYFDSKLAALELARSYTRERGLPIITVFPGTVVGPGDIHKDISELVDRVYRSALLFTFTGGTSFVDVRDCARGIYLSLKKGTPGSGYIISGKDEDNLSYKDFMKRIADTALSSGSFVRDRFMAVPHPLALSVGFISELFNPSSSLTTALVQSGKMTHAFTSGKAKNELGYAPEYDLRDSITDCYSFLPEASVKGL